MSLVACSNTQKGTICNDKSRSGVGAAPASTGKSKVQVVSILRGAPRAVSSVRILLGQNKIKTSEKTSVALTLFYR